MTKLGVGEGELPPLQKLSDALTPEPSQQRSELRELRIQCLRVNEYISVRVVFVVFSGIVCDNLWLLRTDLADELRHAKITSN